MAYRVEGTDRAEEQLRETVLYRAELTGKDGALRLLDQLERELGRLALLPEAGNGPRYSVLRARGYRVLTVEKQLVFYKVDRERETVTVYAVVDGRRDYLNLV